MKVFLMHPDRDFDLEAAPPPNKDDLVQDLELNTLWMAMAAEDDFLFDVAAKAVSSSLTGVDVIVYRQQVLADCLAHPDIVGELYDLAVEALLTKRKVWGFLFRSPESILQRSTEILTLLVDVLTRLRKLADEHAAGFRSHGFVRFFTMLQEELDDAYFQLISDHLKELSSHRGTLMSIKLGPGLKGVHHVLRRPREQTWRERLFDRSGYSFQIADRDEAGARALSVLEGRGLNLVANALAQSTDHIMSFFRVMRSELAFYLGCLNLHDKLTAKGEPICTPSAEPPGSQAFCVRGLYDVCLTLNLDERVVGNDVDADGRNLVVITGANQGGKSTFLRSVGLAQLMTQCGMFAPAESCRMNVCQGVFTHFKREEDATMESGKLDEELSRMSAIADAIGGGCLLLCNESFASTNEREGSQIARQIVRALTEAGVKIFYVTHLFDLAHGLHRDGADTALFLRAERRADGRRTFRLTEGEPLPTSYGEDLYRRIFQTAPESPDGDGRIRARTLTAPESQRP